MKKIDLGQSTYLRANVGVFLGMVLSGLFPAISFAHLTPEEQADSDRLRTLIAAAPRLSVERIELHPAVALEGISAIAADRQGNLYVLHRPTDPDVDPVVVLDARGNLIRSWGKGIYQIPHGIRIAPAGNVWTVDARLSKVYKFTPEGRLLLEIEVGDIPDSDRAFCGATDVAFSPTGNGHVYVSDGHRNGRVIEYDAAGNKVTEWGSRGTGPGEFNLAHGIVVGPDRNIYLADQENGRIQWFDLQGNFLGERKFGGQFYNVTFDADGQLWASVHPKGVPLDEESWVVKLDNARGRILGKVESRSHELGIGPDGSILPATRSGILLVFRLRP